MPMHTVKYYLMPKALRYFADYLIHYCSADMRIYTGMFMFIAIKCFIIILSRIYYIIKMIKQYRFKSVWYC